MRTIRTGAALTALFALGALVAAEFAGAPALASGKGVTPIALKTPGGKFADRLPAAR